MAAVLSLTAGQQISQNMSMSQSLTFWNSPGSTVTRTATSVATGLPVSRDYGPLPFNHVTDRFTGKITLLCTSGTIYYTTVGADDRSNLTLQNTRTTTAEALADTDANSTILFTNAGATTATVQSNVPPGWKATCVQRGAGIVTFAASGGSVVNRSSFTRTAGLNAVMYLECVSNPGSAPVIVSSGDGQV